MQCYLAQIATLGAAYLASGVLDLKTVELLPYSISMGFYNGITKKIIDYKTNYPTVGFRRFQTLVDDQQILRIDIYEGESLLSRRCKHICQVLVNELNECYATAAIALSNRKKLDILIELDQNGYFNVNVIDIATREHLNVRVDYNSVAIVAFERSPYEKIVIIDDWLTSFVNTSELQLSKYIEQLDKLFEIVLKHASDISSNSCCGSDKSIAKETCKRVLLAKKYISKNRLCVSYDDCEQLADKLIEFLKEMSTKNKQLKFILDNNLNNDSSYSSCIVM
jgi:molecular chaperone DnaK (HSP70)